MNVVGWIIFGAICLFTTWLLIDTIIWIVKRIKSKKEIKQKESADKVDD